MISRRQARRQALILLYQWDLSGSEIGSQYEGELDPWAKELAETTAARAPELDERITAASDGWTADRLGAVERSALRVAISELDRGEVPAEVAIDEAVTFAKRYSTDEAGKLVNGILGGVQRADAAQRNEHDGGGDLAAEHAQRGVSADESLQEAEELLGRVEEARKRLDTADPREAIDIFEELADLVKQVDEEIERARRAAEADAAGA